MPFLDKRAAALYNDDGMKNLGCSSGLPAVFLTFFIGVIVLPDIGSEPFLQNKAPLASQSPLMPPLPDQGRSIPAKGKFLVSSRDMKDPRFMETVILLMEYGMNGAIGLIVNHPTEVKLSSVLPDMKGLENRQDIVYIGGPVNQRQMLMLIQSKDKPGESQHVFQDIYASGSRKVLEAMIGKTDTDKKFRVYAGYSGWAPYQLDRELLRGDWHVVEADVKTIFEKESSQIWPELIRRGSAQWVKAVNGRRKAIVSGLYPFRYFSL